MAFKKTYAFIRGTWDGVPGESNFTQDPTVFASPEEFVADYYDDINLTEVVTEFVGSGDIINRARAMSADGKVKINTTEFFDEAAHDSCAGDSRWSAEVSLTKAYIVAEAPLPEDVNTFDEDLGIYYYTVEHLF